MYGECLTDFICISSTLLLHVSHKTSLETFGDLATGFLPGNGVTLELGCKVTLNVTLWGRSPVDMSPNPSLDW